MMASVVAKNLLSPAVVRILPFAAFMTFVIASSFLPEPAAGGSGWDMRFVYVLRTAVVAALLLAFWRHYSELAWMELKRCAWLPAVLTGMVVFVIWIALDQPWATMGEPAPFDPRKADGAIDWMITVPRLIGLAIVVPVMEELFWRSFIQRWIDTPQFLNADPRRASRRAFLVTAALFALEHNLLLAGLLAGLAYGALYLRSGNLWSPVIAHAVTNALLGAWILATGSWHLW